MGVFNNNGLTNKWEWNPPTRNLLVYNNIFADSPAAWEFREEPEGLISDYNMYSNVGQTPEEPNSIYGNAAFADAASIDFRLPANSPAIGAGYPTRRNLWATITRQEKSPSSIMRAMNERAFGTSAFIRCRNRLMQR